jgi:2-keto-4-pentenoate hydratase/2-oxohepta-3-ene-1,7-dioic acid hydratase in catechol pathway
MKLASYLVGDKPHYGIVAEGGIIDLSSRIGRDFPTLRKVIEADALALASACTIGAAPDFRADQVCFVPPIQAPEKIWCIGANYVDRNAEHQDPSELPRYPSLFARSPTSVVGHDQPIVRPRVSRELDYEGGIVLVIGKQGRHVARERAFAHIFGLTLCNDGSVRDWLRHGRSNVTQGKNFDRSGSIGPWIVTADELDPRGPIEIMTRVNGETRQHNSTARLMFPFDHLVAYLTTFATLKPGDLIVTGTPTGAGAGFDPPRWLVPGDTVEVEAPGIGILRNKVVDEV